MTTDGGQTWLDRHPNTTTPYAFFDVWFHDDRLGWIAGFQGIYRTTDGGDHWTRSTSPQLGWNTSVTFVDSLTGWATNPTGTIFKSTDGGVQWFRADSLGWKWFRRIRFANERIGWAVGSLLYETKAIVCKTTDGGYHWTVQDSASPVIYRDIHVLDSLDAWVVGDGGRALYTTNGGGIWFTSGTNNGDNYADVTFRGNQTWIAGGLKVFSLTVAVVQQ